MPPITTNILEMDSSLHAGWNYAHPEPGEEIMITGLSGCYPESDNVYEFADNLFNKVDLITADDRRWSIKHPEIPERIGKINNISKFDASFFGIHYKQAHCMDPMCRMLLEKTFEALIDAGINPQEIRGTRTGVFIGACFSESEKTWFYEKLQPHGFALTGCARAMYANRLSYWMGVNGPSFTVDSACSSSMYAIEFAYRSIREGHCDIAIVGGSNMCLHPYVSLQFARLGVLNPDGKCKCFDEKANGYTRSEAICVVVLQKAKDARRVYAQLIHSKANCDGYKEQGITYPSGHMQKVLLDEFYLECAVDPSTINYMEAHGTGTKVGDPEEIRALESIFCNGRKNPLLIGSVKSNIGHTEPVSGLCSITKVIIGMETGYIPPNINFTKARKEMAALQDGKMVVVTEKTKWEGGYVGVNSFGFGGANCHILLKSNPKNKINFGLPKDNLPRLLCISGRTQEAVDSILNDVASRPLDAEYVRLLQEGFKYNIPGHLYRGFALYNKKQVVNRKVELFEYVPKPVWFIFTGLGSQWIGIGSTLMELPAFAATIEKCHKVLSSKGLKIKDIITSKDPKIFEDNVNLTVAITCMQVALVDVLLTAHIKPEQMVGYSIGELACAYADQCLTLEQTVMCSYLIGIASKQQNTEIELMKRLLKVIPEPKKRSSRWLATMEDTKLAITCSAQYLVHSLSCSVTLRHTIPDGSLLVEVGPIGHLQQLLRQALGNEIRVISLLGENQLENISVLFTTLGELYVTGCNPRLEFLYPDIQFPVSRSTPMVSPLIKWDHSDDWYVTKFETQEKIKSGERTVTVVLSDEDMEFVAGHIIDGRTLFPATGYLCLVWETVGMMKGQLFTDMPIVFEDVKFLRATNVPKEGRIYLMIMVQKVSGYFEVIESGQSVVTGRIRVPDDVEKENIDFPNQHITKRDDYILLNERDIYKELRLRGYNYSGLFRGLKSCDTTATVGEIAWNGNYVSFMDTMLQMQILQVDTRGLFVPTSINKVVIDAYKHKKMVMDLEKGQTVPVYVHKNIQTIVAAGITIRALNASAIARRKPLGEPVLETYKFVPNAMENLTLEQSMRILVQLAFENNQNIKVRTAELLDNYTVEGSPLLSVFVQRVLGDLPLIQADINILTTEPIEEMNGITISEKKLVTESNCLLIIATNVINRSQLLQTALNGLIPGGFVVARESLDANIETEELSNVFIILEHKLDNEKIILLKKRDDAPLQTVVDVTCSTDNLSWLPTLQAAVKSDPSTIVFAQGDELNGVIGLVNCIRKEPTTNTVRCVFIIDKDAPAFDLKNEFYASELRKGLAVSVLKDGIWGTYRHLQLSTQDDVKVEHAYVNVTVRGDLSSLKWLEGNLHSDRKLKANQLLVQVYYSALNFRDIMTATGRLAPEVVARGRFEQECVQGLEFAGRMLNGRRIMGMVAHGGLATMVAAEPEFLWDIPDNWSLEDAVTVPVVYGTVFYAMVMEGKIQSGQSILIHAGSGGIGQAAINVALYFGCTVFTTVGTQKKRDFIKSSWPQIKDSHIGNSRDISFEQMIMVETNGRGVDLILNSLAEEKLQASVRCLAYGGKFLEIGKFDLANDNPLPLNLFAKEASFHGIMLDHLFRAPGDMKRRLSDGLNQFIKDGAVKPLTRTVFEEHEIEEAFRFMATGKHVGKVLIKIRDEEPDKMVVPPKRLVAAVPRFLCSSEGTYIITGGLGGFGLELTDWLVLRGARNITLTSRKGMTTGYQALRIKTWRSYGVQIKISTCDITTFEGCKTLIEEASKSGPIEGIFNLAVVLRDGLFENQTVENFEVSFGPKAVATKHLDELTRRMCPKLKLFVVFSSVSCGRGNAGQTNYGMANSVMERICELRKEAGFPALAVEWGAIGEVGLVAEMQENHGELEIGGTLQQRVSSCLSVLDQFLRQSDPIVASMVVAEKRSTAGAGGNIIEAVVNILGIRDIKTVSFHSSLAELGMDSIMAVEIKQTLEREFEVFLTPQDIRSLTFARLQEIASEKETVKTEQQTPEQQPEIGMKIMMRTIGDEESAKEPIKILSSLSPAGCKNKAILIPGIEGMSSIMEPLASNLSVQAVCLQLGFANQIEDIQGMALSFLERTLEQIKGQKTFTLVGYSYGTAITLELTALLEKQGKIGNVILIDGSPVMLKEMVNQQITASTEEQFQNNVLSVIVNIYMTGEVTNHITSAFEKCSTWEEKINSIIENAPKNTIHTEKHQRDVCNAIYQRLKAMAMYESTVGKLKSHIKLVKPKQHTVLLPFEDFGLSVLAENPVEIVYVDGNHVTILENPASADEINKMFEEEVIFKESLISNNEKIEIRDQPTLA